LVKIYDLEPTATLLSTAVYTISEIYDFSSRSAVHIQSNMLH